MKGINLLEGGSAKGMLDAWRAHFVNLLRQPPQVPHDFALVNTQFDEFDVTELTEDKKWIKGGKACGDDDIASEIIKRIDIVVLQYWQVVFLTTPVVRVMFNFRL